MEADMQTGNKFRNQCKPTSNSNNVTFKRRVTTFEKQKISINCLIAILFVVRSNDNYVTISTKPIFTTAAESLFRLWS